MENITPFDLGGLAKDLDNQLIGMRSHLGQQRTGRCMKQATLE